MTVTEVPFSPWTRKHDHPAIPTVPLAPRTLYPTSLEEVIEVCASRVPGQRATAAGSHWSLSTGAVADSVFVETHDPRNTLPAMGHTLFEVVPGCLSQEFIDYMAGQAAPAYSTNDAVENGGEYYVHVETGKRVYQLYAELDQGDDLNPDSLAVLLRDQRGNASYLGPWAFQTLGGAGGQTVFGALTTGTHGGDFRMGPIAESVAALHLVADGGRHYWIEPESRIHMPVPFTDTGRLRNLYGQDRYRGNAPTGNENFTVIRDDDTFHAVLIGSWRFGIVYSVVLRAVRQYTLHQERRLTTWAAAKTQIADRTSALFRIQPPQPPSISRFLQVVVNVTPNANFTGHLVGVTKRWNVPMAVNPISGSPAGRDERVGAVVEAFNTRIGAPRFANAGNSATYSPDPTMPGLAAPPNFLEQACRDANIVVGALRVVIAEVEDFINSNGAVIGGTIAAVVAAGGGAALLGLLAALAVILLILLAFLAALNAATGPRLGGVLNDLKDSLLNRPDPAERAAGMFVWHMIGQRMFGDQQGPLDYEAISYAVMDGHDYFDASCNVNVDSIEVFFNAADPMLIAYIDALLAFEVAQETMGRAFVGYFSLRFTGQTRALIGPERFEETCVIEIAGLQDVTGVRELIDFAIMLALDPNFGGTLHWGQRNPSSMAEIQARFGDTPVGPPGPLHRWRNALARLTDNGRQDGFSNEFSRQTGLEIVTPRVNSLTGPPAPSPVGTDAAVEWDCRSNPPAVVVSVRILSPSGVVTNWTALPTSGLAAFNVAEPGPHLVTATASLTVNGETRTAEERIYVTAL